MGLTPEQRSLRASIAAHTMHATTGNDRMAAARRTFLASFEQQVDPDILDPDERARRAEHLYRAHMKRLSLASSKARRRKKAS
jgi:hypothetical protein